MGITGLLPIVKNIIKKKHIGVYSHSKVGIDGHAWIHQVLPSISYEMYTNKPFIRHLSILKSKIDVLINFHITPIFIFDGDFLESKEITTNERMASRNKAKAEVEFYIKRNEMGKARELMKRCVSVTPQVFRSVLEMLRLNSIEYIVSPYEADAQLYFLQRINYIDHIMTEDSDLIVYGSSSVLYKYTGSHVDEYNSSNLIKAKDVYFKENILNICILSGCDYIDSIRGIGLITAHKLLKEKKTVDAFVQHLAALKKEIPLDYLINYERAKLTFLHHIVFNPLINKRQFLTEPEICCDFLGTLNDIPLKFATLSGEIEISRHYRPNSAVNNHINENSIETQSIDDCIVDTQLVLPYFKS